MRAENISICSVRSGRDGYHNYAERRLTAERRNGRAEALIDGREKKKLKINTCGNIFIDWTARKSYGMLSIMIDSRGATEIDRKKQVLM